MDTILLQKSFDSFTLEEAAIDCSNFLPSENKAFWTYEGSLTTPPLLESVIWILFKTPMKISTAQMNAMRSLNFASKDSKKGKMVNNYRTPCPLHERSIYSM